MSDYKLVPVEPTEAMIDAARDIHEGEKYLPIILYTDIYKAMLAAAPAVQGEPVGEVRLELGAQPYVFAELYSKSLPSLAPGTKLYTAPQPAPDIAGLVDALESLMESESRGRVMPVGKSWDQARKALSAYRKGGEA